MGHIKPELISTIGESLGINLHPEAASVLAPDVEYRVRDILQEAIKYARHGCRRKLQVADFNNALKVRDLERVYGYDAADKRRYAQVAGATDVFYALDTLHMCADIIYEPLPPPPHEAGVVLHWFLVDGVKPRIPENAVPKQLRARRQVPHGASPHSVQPGASAAPAEAPPARADAPQAPAAGQQVVAVHGGGRSQPATPAQLLAADKDGRIAQLIPVAKHVVSEEQHELMRVFAQVLLSPSSENNLSHAVFVSMATDGGLDQLVPYLVHLIAQEVSASHKQLVKLQRLLQAAHALVVNTANNLEQYLVQLLPAVMTCLLASKLGTPRSDHWSLRRSAAACLAKIVARFPEPSLSLLPRVCKTCIGALTNTNKPITTHYGAICGLHAMGPRAVRLLLLPVSVRYYKLLVPVLAQRSKIVKRCEAMQCLGALQLALCSCCRDMVTRTTSAGLEPALMYKLQALADHPMAARRSELAKDALRTARLTAVDVRIKELEIENQMYQARQQQLAAERMERERLEAEEREAAARAMLERERLEAEAKRREAAQKREEALRKVEILKAAADRAAQAFSDTQSTTLEPPSGDAAATARGTGDANGNVDGAQAAGGDGPGEAGVECPDADAANDDAHSMDDDGPAFADSPEGVPPPPPSPPPVVPPPADSPGGDALAVAPSAAEAEASGAPMEGGTAAEGARGAAIAQRSGEAADATTPGEGNGTAAAVDAATAGVGGCGTAADGDGCAEAAPEAAVEGGHQEPAGEPADATAAALVEAAASEQAQAAPAPSDAPAEQAEPATAEVQQGAANGAAAAAVDSQVLAMQRNGAADAGTVNVRSAIDAPQPGEVQDSEMACEPDAVGGQTAGTDAEVSGAAANAEAERPRPPPPRFTDTAIAAATAAPESSDHGKPCDVTATDGALASRSGDNAAMGPVRDCVADAAVASASPRVQHDPKAVHAGGEINAPSDAAGTDAGTAAAATPADAAAADAAAAHVAANGSAHVANPAASVDAGNGNVGNALQEQRRGGHTPGHGSLAAVAAAKAPAHAPKTMSIWELDTSIVSALDTAWRDNPDIGSHLDGVYHMFGESMLPWMPLGPLAHVML